MEVKNLVLLVPQLIPASVWFIILAQKVKVLGFRQSHKEQSNKTELLSNGLWNNDEETIQSLMAYIIECLPSTKWPTQAQITCLTEMKQKPNTDIVKPVGILSISSLWIVFCKSWLKWHLAIITRDG